MGICKPFEKHRRLDIKIYAPQHYGFALIYFTGGDYFNRSMRYRDPRGYRAAPTPPRHSPPRHRRRDIRRHAAAAFAATPPRRDAAATASTRRGRRFYAKALGYSLCDKGLRKAGRQGSARDAQGRYVDNKVSLGPPVVCETERAVFDELGLDWKEPEERVCADNAAAIAQRARTLRTERENRGQPFYESESDDESSPEEAAATRFRI